MMPTLPDYQAYLPTTPMVRRISNLVGTNRGDHAKEQDYKWWDLFSGSVPAAPPAYEDIFPHDEVDTKRASAAQAAADTVADNKCAELFDQVEVVTGTQAESSATAMRRPSKLGKVRIGSSNVVTREQQDQLRLAHAEKVKRLSRDRNLFFIWVCLSFSFSLFSSSTNDPLGPSRLSPSFLFFSFFQDPNEPPDSPPSPHVPRLVLQPSPRSLDPRLRFRRLSTHPSPPRYKHASPCGGGAMNLLLFLFCLAWSWRRNGGFLDWNFSGTQHSTAGGGEMFGFRQLA
jgi:hypothetical protein